MLRSDTRAATYIPENRLEEASGLAEAIALNIVGARIVRLNRVNPALYFGKGAVEELAEERQRIGADLIVADCALTPGQQRNLERAFECKVIDRTALILEIFGARARTKEGRLQVELAHLTYQRSRLVRSWTHLERQRGGFGFMGGPGESQIELDRRLIDDRIVRIKKDLETVRKRRDIQRKARRRVPFPVVALVGYTNAGKSTLFNRLTGAKVMSKDMLFATLDPTMRSVDLPSGAKAILSDTVGFISDLPTQLISAFRATLEEVIDAEVILHVRDIAREDSDHQALSVHTVLKELGLEDEVDRGLIEAWNKLDLLDQEQKSHLRASAGSETLNANALRVPVSAQTGEGCDRLLEVLDQALSSTHQIIEIVLPQAEGRAISWLYENGNVTAREDGETAVRLTVSVAPDIRDKFFTRFGKVANVAETIH